MAVKNFLSRSSKNKPYVSPITLSIVTLLLAVVIQLLPDAGVPSFTGHPAKTKPYATWNAFYGHYMMEHTNGTCRLLHVIGTCITSLVLLSDPALIVCGFFAGTIGVFLCGALRGLQTGFLEFALIGIVFFAAAKATTGTGKKAMLLPLIGYSFAWVGHFYYEHNHPATFIYPTYSLISDYRMVYNVFAGQEGL